MGPVNVVPVLGALVLLGLVVGVVVAVTRRSRAAGPDPASTAAQPDESVSVAVAPESDQAAPEPDEAERVDSSPPAGVATEPEPPVSTAREEADPAPAPAPAADMPAAPATADAPAAPASEPPADDFRKIEGIGPKLAGALQAAGIRTYQQLADSDEATLRAALRTAGVRATASLPQWPERARELAGKDG